MTLWIQELYIFMLLSGSLFTTIYMILYAIYIIQNLTSVKRKILNQNTTLPLVYSAMSF